jgi:archaellum biogenesis protein FlaJ (TadC family)
LWIGGGIAGALALFFLGATLEGVVCAAFLLFLPGAFAELYSEYLEEKKTREIESFIPSALLQLSSFPRKTPLEKMVSSLAKAEFGELSKEFSKAQKAIARGASVKQALNAVAERNSSLLLSRIIRLLLELHESGAEFSNSFKKISEDVFSIQAIERERSSSFSLQKYTILVAGGVLAPLVLGLVVGMVSSLNFSTTGFGEFLKQGPEAENLASSTILASQIYLVIFAFLAGSFVAMQEGKEKKAVIYYGLLIPLSLLVFNAAKGW